MTAPDPRIESVVMLIAQAPGGVGVSDLEPKINPSVPRRTLQLWLADLVTQKRLKARGAGRATRYFVPKIAPVPSVQPVANPAQTTPPTGPLPSAPLRSGVAAGRTVAAPTKPSLPGYKPGPWPAATAPGTVTQPPVPPPTMPAISRTPPVAAPVENAAVEATDSEPGNGYDPQFARVFRKTLPHVVSSCGSRDSAEDDLVMEGVRLFQDDSITIRTMTAQGVAILDALTEEEAASWGVKPYQYQRWRKYWR